MDEEAQIDGRLLSLGMMNANIKHKEQELEALYEKRAASVMWLRERNVPYDRLQKATGLSKVTLWKIQKRVATEASTG